MLGRPRDPAPDDFDEAYVRLGWEARDQLGMDTARFTRHLNERGRDELRRRRRNYVLGRRLSSLKPGTGVL